MFSPLARGGARWDGEIYFDENQDELLSENTLLPQILLKPDQPVKSPKSAETAYDYGRLSLPKTYVTRKGALLLFTPSEELLTNDKQQRHVDVYEDGLTLGTIGNLAESVLRFGKKEEQAWEGVPNTPTPKPNEKGTHQPINDRKAFLRFLHYLDSESLTTDKHAQPGCAPDFYLDELRTTSRVVSSRRRSKDVQTPYSYRTYSSFLEEDNMSDIVRHYIKSNKMEKQMTTDNDEDIQDNPDIDNYLSTSQLHTSPPLRSHSFPQQFYYTSDETLRPSTAPLPPAPESPRANPRITSGRRPPPARALGSRPENLDFILRAEIDPGRGMRRGPSPRFKFSRNSSPTHATSSRAGSPDHGVMPRFETPAAMSEVWSRAADDVIHEETEVPSTRPSSGASYQSVRSSSRIMDKKGVHSSSRIMGQESVRSSSRTMDKPENTRAVSAASSRGKENDKHRNRSATASSVSYQKDARTISGRSRGYTSSQSRISVDHYDEYDEQMTSRSKQVHSPAVDDTNPRCMSAPVEVRSYGSVTSVANQDYDDVSLASREVVTQSRLSHTSSGFFNQDMQSRDVRSRGSNRSRTSSANDSSPSTSQWPPKNSSRNLSRGSKDEEGVALRTRSASRENTPISRASVTSRPASAPISIQHDNATIATLGSEADIADVIHVLPRSRTLLYDGSDAEGSTGSRDECWPVNADGELEIDIDDDELSGYGSAAEEMNLNLPSSPGPTSSGLFRPDSSWSQAPQNIDDPRQQSNLDIKEPSETGATGLRSCSPSPSPIPQRQVLIADESDADSIVSEDKTQQWPPEISPSPPPTVPSVTVNEQQVDVIESLTPVAPDIYQETIDIEKSRPSSPKSGREPNEPVSVSESVIKYLESAHEPDERPHSGRALKSTPPDGAQKQEAVPEEVPIIDTTNPKEKTINNSAKEQVKESSVQSVIPKSESRKKSTNAKEKLAIGIDVTKETPKQKASTLEETEARREFVNSLLIKSNPSVDRSRLELEGTGKEGEDGEAVTTTSPKKPAEPKESPKKSNKPQTVKPAEPPKNDLSDLAALINRNKSAKSSKEKKEVKKKPKSPKPPKKEITIDPQNINFEAFNTPEMLEHMDDDLKALIQQQNPQEESTGDNKQDSEMVGTTDLKVPQVAKRVSPEKKNAHTPSKPKKLSKEEQAKKRAEARKAEKKRKEEEKKRKEEEKQRREEELRLLKEREEEQEKARKEAEMKQKAIEDERAKRLAEEEEARREEEEAMEKLKDAKKKAREEREQRRAAEAERRKQEVQRKREEKKKREEEMREKEREMEQMKVDQEKRKQELMEAKKRQEELDRLEEQRRLEEEQLRLMEEEEEQRRLEEEQIREAEEELRRLQEEREYKEQMRRIAEAREQKLREEEQKRLRMEDEERRKLEEERRKIQQQEEEKCKEEKRRIDIAKRLEAVARMRLAHEAARRKTMLLRRREQNLDRFQHLRSVRQEQGLTRSRVFSYFINIPRSVWEVPIGFKDQKKGFRSVKKKSPPKK